MIDVDDTSRCSLEDLCEACGAKGEWATNGVALDVVTAETPVGVVCVTLCPSCVEAGRAPKIPSYSDRVRRVCAHCEHLGCTVDEMGEAMRRQRHAS